MFSKSKEGPAPSRSSTKASHTPANRNSLSIIATDVVIQGNVRSEGEVQLDGQLQGDVQCESVTIGAQGRLVGQITARTVIVRGTVEGVIRAQNIVIERTAQVVGTLQQESVSIEAGARVDGHFEQRPFEPPPFELEEDAAPLLLCDTDETDMAQSDPEEEASALPPDPATRLVQALLTQPSPPSTASPNLRPALAAE